MLRASLDRLSAFVDELGDYGDPKPAVWAANYAAFNAGRTSAQPVEAR